MATPKPNPKEIVKFLRQKDFEFMRELGEGACGKTVLLRDPIIDQTFVCKKYAPRFETMRADLYKNFIREIGILHRLSHTNVVRVFNYHLYPRELTGYIVMEFVDGPDVESYLASKPEKIDEVFLQTVEGFAYLEQNEILHRDIRPQNILVSDEGITKIIDFGFGKRIGSQGDFDKSISLAWWCEPPLDFVNGIYDYTTEVYFVGKLFEKIISEKRIEQFAYEDLLRRMCIAHHDKRIASFGKIKQEILSGEFSGIEFSDYEKISYRMFADVVVAGASKIERGTKYFADAEEIERKLLAVYEKVMLEEHVTSINLVLRCFINGMYYYSKGTSMDVDLLSEFISLMKGSSKQKKEIILNNLFTRLDQVTRYDDKPTPPPPPEGEFDDDIPF